MRGKTLIVITGPTAVGKTQLCLDIAKHFDIPIINADSRQIYRELKIGTAAPTEEQLRQVRHYFVATQSIKDYFSASIYEQQVMTLLEELFKNSDYALMTGGSMMYIDAVCNGIDDIPTIDDIKAKRQKNLYLKINEKMESLEDMHKYDSLILKLSKQNKDPMPLINDLLEMINTNDRTYNDIQSVTFKSKDSKSKGKKDNKKEKAKGFSDVKEKSIISVNVGKKDNVRPNQLVVYFHDELKIHREHFGKIEILENSSIIQVKKEALRFLKNTHGITFNGKKIKIQVL